MYDHGFHKLNTLFGFLATAPLRGPGIASELQRICDTVVSHIAEVTFHEAVITRCVLHFKVDSRDQAWLLYSTSIRLSSSPPTQSLNMENVLHVPNEIILMSTPSHTRDEDSRAPAKLQESCVGCDSLALSAQLYPVTYKVIIDYYENVTQVLNDQLPRRHKKRSSTRTGMEEDDPDDDEQIPPILRAVHPRLTGKLFRKFRHDPVFMYKTCSVCESCFLQHAEYANTSLVVGPSLSSFLKPGTQIPPTSNRRTRRQDEEAWKSLSAFHQRSQSPTTTKAPPGSTTTTAATSQLEARTTPAVVRPPPEFPATITTSTEFRQSMQHDFVPVFTATTSPSSTVDVQSLIAQREQQYFNELAKNKNAKTHHPLQHLVTTQRKLLAAEQQTGLKRSPGKQGSQVQSSWFANYSSQPKQDALNAYRTKLTAIVPEDFAERMRRSKNKNKKSKDMSATTSSTDLSLSETAANHQKFLQDTLRQFQREVLLIAMMIEWSVACSSTDTPISNRKCELARAEPRNKRSERASVAASRSVTASTSIFFRSVHGMRNNTSENNVQIPRQDKQQTQQWPELLPKQRRVCHR